MSSFWFSKIVRLTTIDRFGISCALARRISGQSPSAQQVHTSLAGVALLLRSLGQKPPQDVDWDLPNLTDDTSGVVQSNDGKHSWIRHAAVVDGERMGWSGPCLPGSGKAEWLDEEV
jgi:hypothetical protein